MGSPPERQADLEAKRSGGYKALDILQRQLTEHDFIANDVYSAADIALYAYTHVANEGGFDLSTYASIGAWLSRVESHEHYVPMRKR